MCAYKSVYLHLSGYIFYFSICLNDYPKNQGEVIALKVNQTSSNYWPIYTKPKRYVSMDT